MKKEKPATSTSSAPAPVPAAAAAVSKQSESKDNLEGANSNKPPSPRVSKTPKQEAEIEASGTVEKQIVHTGTLTPKPEVCLLLLFS